jgi:hypothetical protein
LSLKKNNNNNLANLDHFSMESLLYRLKSYFSGQILANSPLKKNKIQCLKAGEDFIQGSHETQLGG